MTDQLNFRTLTQGDLGQMYRSFIEAFANYQVNMKMSREAFDDRMLSKLNIRFDLSPGIFSKDKLIGFIFHTTNNYEEKLSAYNGGTGVIPGYLGRGLTSAMYDFIFPELVKKGVKKCVLEVLVNNKSAIRAYQKAGFEKTKTFQCLMLRNGQLKGASDATYFGKKVGSFSIQEYQSLVEVEPGMLDQLSQIQHHLQKEYVLECRKDTELIAYIIFQPTNGRIAQMAVKKAFRHQGIARSLIHQAHQMCDNKSLSILNIETHHEQMINFFTKMGFDKDLKQFEMQKQLKDV